MDYSIILMVIGVICIIISFFLKDTSKKLEQDLEELSLSIYQETNSLKKRLKIVEEELLLEPNFTMKTTVSAKKPKESVPQAAHSQNKSIAQKKNYQVNEILVNQVIQLNKQGYPIEEISKMSTLTNAQIIAILKDEGKR